MITCSIMNRYCQRGTSFDRTNRFLRLQIDTLINVAAILQKLTHIFLTLCAIAIYKKDFFLENLFKYISSLKTNVIFLCRK